VAELLAAANAPELKDPTVDDLISESEHWLPLTIPCPAGFQGPAGRTRHRFVLPAGGGL
jgi:hypothetical protein